MSYLPKLLVEIRGFWNFRIFDFLKNSRFSKNFKVLFQFPKSVKNYTRAKMRVLKRNNDLRGERINSRIENDEYLDRDPGTIFPDYNFW